MQIHTMAKIGGIGILTISLIAAATTFPIGTTAGVQIYGLNIHDTSKTLAPNESVDDVTLSVNGDIEWDSSHALNKYKLILSVSTNGDDYEPIQTKTQTGISKNATKSYTISGSVLDHSKLSSSNFNPPKGVTYGNDIYVRVTLHLYRNGAQVATVNKSAMGTISISKESLTISGSLNGDGIFRIATS